MEKSKVLGLELGALYSCCSFPTHGDPPGPFSSLLSWASVSPCDSGVTRPGGLPGQASLQVSQIHDPFLLLLSLSALAPLSPGPFLPVSFWCPDPGMRGQTPGLVFWSWILRARCGKGETADAMKWPQNWLCQTWGTDTHPILRLGQVQTVACVGLIHQAVYPG